MFYLSLLFATVVWGLNVIIDKQALRTGHPIEVNFITTMTTALVVCVYFGLAKKNGVQFTYAPQTVLYSVLNGVLIPTSFVVYLYALSKGEISRVVMATATYPIIAILFAVFAFNESVSLSQWIGIVCTIFGIFLVMK
ncbi:EamA family transporter [Ammoniphilus sp. CFH 90114]|uniref:EamA family transporter n=1 Tax=Ammoniphilus sp. CFH 90114 TaxID=2493665 RepID=UPI00100DD67E|nr:DMT family transporter [Ammoniphilus sp. CFH 90114]RXT13853.1 EamA family transporter [Ammoniphilus sp. CFH 90114]